MTSTHQSTPRSEDPPPPPAQPDPEAAATSPGHACCFARGPGPQASGPSQDHSASRPCNKQCTAASKGNRTCVHSALAAGCAYPSCWGRLSFKQYTAAFCEAVSIEPASYNERQKEYTKFKRPGVGNSFLFLLLKKRGLSPSHPVLREIKGETVASANVPEHLKTAWQEACNSNSKTTKNKLFAMWCKAGGEWSRLGALQAHSYILRFKIIPSGAGRTAQLARRRTARHQALVLVFGLLRVEYA